MAQALREVRVAGEPSRRWFTSTDMDLIAWYDDDGTLNAFQFCYGKSRAEHALSWSAGGGLRHCAVDDGEAVGIGHKATPILVADGRFDGAALASRFVTASGQLPGDLVDRVVAVLGRPLGAGRG